MAMVLLLIPIVSAIDHCESEMMPGEIPCMVVSTWDYPGDCNAYQVSIYDETPSLLTTLNMSLYGVTGRCNVTFEYTERGSYTLNFTSSDAGTIIVNDSENRYYLYIVALAVFIVLLILGFWLQEAPFVIISGMLSVVMAIHIYMNGFPNLANTFLQNGIVIVLAGIGFFLIMIPSIEY